jgi:hypothetical protein
MSVLLVGSTSRCDIRRIKREELFLQPMIEKRIKIERHVEKSEEAIESTSPKQIVSHISAVERGAR